MSEQPDAVVVFLSDVHANLPGLQCVRLGIDSRGDATALYHLGDLVSLLVRARRTRTD